LNLFRPNGDKGGQKQMEEDAMPRATTTLKSVRTRGALLVRDVFFFLATAVVMAAAALAHASNAEVFASL